MMSATATTSGRYVDIYIYIDAIRDARYGWIEMTWVGGCDGAFELMMMTRRRFVIYSLPMDGMEWNGMDLCVSSSIVHTAKDDDDDDDDDDDEG